jgi:hypothetical protein
MEFQTGTTIEVQSGADICSDNVSIQGVYTGTGTLCNGPLPVELSTFTATFKKNLIELFWKTETEVNNFGFNVERKVNEGEWNMIAFIKGNGNSNSPKEYNYTDKDLFIGGSKFQYRLKQIDNDGKSEYSDIIEVEVVPNEYELSQNYPNPFNPSTKIRFTIPVTLSGVEGSFVTLKVYDVLGNEAATLVNEEKPAGSYEVEFEASSLTSGIYFYKLKSGNFVETKKMILLR